MKDNGPKKCRFCGKEIMVIEWGIYRKTVVDAESVDVYPDPEGEQFIRFDGSKIKGFEAGIDCVFPTEPAYRPHRWSCEG